MPYINKKRIKEPRQEYKHEKTNNSMMYYNSPAWLPLRNNYMSTHPLCQSCLEHGRTTPAEHVHHKRMFLRGKTEEDRWKLFLDYNNLMALCTPCHYAMHNKANRLKLNSIDYLTDKEYEER